MESIRADNTLFSILASQIANLKSVIKSIIKKVEIELDKAN